MFYVAIYKSREELADFDGSVSICIERDCFQAAAEFALSQEYRFKEIGFFLDSLTFDMG